MVPEGDGVAGPAVGVAALVACPSAVVVRLLLGLGAVVRAGCGLVWAAVMLARAGEGGWHGLVLPLHKGFNGPCCVMHAI